MPAPLPIPWPTTADPGVRPGEGNGDLLNCYAVPEGDRVVIRRVGGLRSDTVLGDPTSRIPRGIMSTPNWLIHAWDDSLYTKNLAGVTAAATGLTLSGSDPVTMAANLASPNVIVIVTSTGAYTLDLTTSILTSYPDGDLGTVDTVEYYAGYYLFTRTSGDVLASGLQSTSIDPLSIARAEYSDDFLRRVKNAGSVVLFMGDKTIEIWQDVGSTPFPLQRAPTAIDVGLMGKWAVAGGANEWEHSVMFVASDYTVRQVVGYEARIVSNNAVQRDIYAYRDRPDEVRCFVYAFGSYSVFCIRTTEWTWEYCVNTGWWHRRASYNGVTWRGQYATQWNRRWYVQDTLVGQVCEVDADLQTEDGQRIISLVESAAIKEFPASIRIPQIDVELVTGVGSDVGTDLDPAVLLSWSHDGGGSWANPLVRSMGKPGEFTKKVTFRNLGRSTHQGVRFRLWVPDPVPMSLYGGVSPRTQPSRPRQVG